MKVWIAFLLVFAVVTAHKHHHHNDEPAHHKYSRQANEADKASSHRHDHGHHGHSHAHHHHHHGHDHGHGHSHSNFLHKYLNFDENFEFSGWLSPLNDRLIRVWVFAISATILISVAPFVILFTIRSQISQENPSTLRVFLAFGAGALLGDAFLHLIPHAQAGYTEDSLFPIEKIIIIGIIIFQLVETLVLLVLGGSSHSHHHHSTETKPSNSVESAKDEKEKSSSTSSSSSSSSSDDDDSDGDDYSRHVNHFKTSALVNLLADIGHNVMDGVAIGASFTASTTIGIVTTVCVLAHEVPHEIGDFAILVQSGFSKADAMYAQLYTAGGALFGCIVSLLIADAGDWISNSTFLALTAGGFIYVAMVSVFPELLKVNSKGQAAKQTIALLFGIWIMDLIAKLE